MIKYVNEESSWESYTTDNERFNWFDPYEDEENTGFIDADNYEDPNDMDSIMWSTGKEIIDAVDNSFNKSEVDSIVKGFKPTDWPFDFWSYYDWLERLPVDLQKRIDDYVHSEYKSFFEKDDIWWVEPMKRSTLREEEIPHYTVKSPNRKRALYDALDDEYDGDYYEAA